MSITVLIKQQQDLFPAFACSEYQAHLDATTRFNSNILTQTENRIKHKALTVAKCLHGSHRPGKSSAAADETSPICFKLPAFYLTGCRFTFLQRQAVGDIEALIIFASGSPVSKQCLLLRKCFGLDEEFIEGWVLAIGVMRGQRQLDKAGKVKATSIGGMIDQGYPPKLYIIFRGNDDLGFTGDGIIGALK